MSEDTAAKPATFTAMTGELEGVEVPVHFNPASLQYSLKNVLRKGGGIAKSSR